MYLFERTSGLPKPLDERVPFGGAAHAAEHSLSKSRMRILMDAYALINRSDLFAESGPMG